jgi:secreted trypsin-like serine protease
MTGLAQLQIDKPNKRNFLHGIISYGVKCTSTDRETFPGVYTRVSSYLEWILDNMDTEPITMDTEYDIFGTKTQEQV